LKWPRQPLIYEINTWPWLNELGRKYYAPVTLASVPDAEWDAVAKPGLNGVWLMGVWERSPAGRAIAVNNHALAEEFRQALPDAQPDDIVGSAYCIRRYNVDERLGGNEGLAAARQALARRGIRLMLDFVPNHVAPDHPWVGAHRDYFIQGDADDLQRDPGSFCEVNREVYACGRDPFFPPWSDVIQVNAFNDGLRAAAAATLIDIAKQADGVRCDMAMLLLNDVFARTWGQRAGPSPPDEYWSGVIAETRAQFPDFLFVAEAYWDLEAQLVQQGFDYCYDKRFYDALAHGDAASVRSCLFARLAGQTRCLRFIENHDEARAASVFFPPPKELAAATILMTSPGAKLLHEGQLEGRKIKVPVFFARRSDEPIAAAIREFHLKLIEIVDDDAFRNGAWSGCECKGLPDDPSFQNIIASSWTGENQRFLIVVNFSETASRGTVELPWKDLGGREWRLADALSGNVHQRAGDELLSQGFVLDLPGWASHCFRVESNVTAEPDGV
jgi:hypothetical protein